MMEKLACLTVNYRKYESSQAKKVAVGHLYLIDDGCRL